MTNNQDVASKHWIVKYFPRTSIFSQTNSRKKPETKRSNFSWSQITLSEPSHQPSTTDTKSEQNSASFIPLTGFPHSIQNIKIDRQTSIPFWQQLNSEHQCLESSSRIAKLDTTTVSRHKFCKTGNEDWTPTVSTWSLQDW